MQDASVKSKIINLINSVRTLMRSTYIKHDGGQGIEADSYGTVPLIFLNILIIVWAVAFG